MNAEITPPAGARQVPASDGAATNVPLAGLRVLVPRRGEAGERLAAAVRSAGGEPVLVPLIEQHPPLDREALTSAVDRFNSGEYSWVAITSAHGARAFVDAGARPTGTRIAAVGPATAAALTAAGFTVDLIPAEFTGAHLAEHLAATILTERSGKGRVLLPLSDLAEPTLERGLSAAGLAPERVTAYRTLPAPAAPEADAALRPRLGAALVLSSSGARALAARFGPLPDETIVAAIGEPTAAELARLHIPATVVASVHTGEGTVAALADYVAARRSPGPAVSPGTGSTSSPTPDLTSSLTPDFTPDLDPEGPTA